MFLSANIFHLSSGVETLLDVYVTCFMLHEQETSCPSPNCRCISQTVSNKKHDNGICQRWNKQINTIIQFMLRPHYVGGREFRLSDCPLNVENSISFIQLWHHSLQGKQTVCTYTVCSFIPTLPHLLFHIFTHCLSSFCFDCPLPIRPDCCLTILFNEGAFVWLHIQ